MSICKFTTAIISSNFDVVLEELSNGININEKSFSCGTETALSYAINCRASNNVIHFLLEHGTDISIDNYNAFKSACYDNNLEAMKLFINRIDIPTEILTLCLKRELSKSAYFFPDTIRFLLEHGANINEIDSLCIPEHISIKIELLLEYGQNIMCKFTDAVLVSIFSSNDLHALKILFEKNLLCVSEIKYSVFKVAIRNNSRDVLSYLLDMGCSLDMNDCTCMINKNGNSRALILTLIILGEHGMDILSLLKN